MKVCSSCGFKMLDNQKYCPRCGLPINAKPPINTSEKIIINDEKQEDVNKINLDMNSNKKRFIKKTIIIIGIITIIIIGGIILFLTISNNNRYIVKERDEYNDKELKEIITYVKSEFASIMKDKNILFIRFDEENNRYLFQSTYESSQEQYYYYPETDEITIEVPGAEAIINKGFLFKTTSWGEPSDEYNDWLSYLVERSLYTELSEEDTPIEEMASGMFNGMLDYAIDTIITREIDGIELHLVRVNEGQPDYEVYEFLLGSDGNMYDYWEAVSNNRLVKF